MTESARTVGEVASLVGVTIRTLHHWDAAGLVVPSQRSQSGYRLYTDADIDRLHQVLIYRETGMELAAIREVLEEPGAVAGVVHLKRQLDLLSARIDQLTRMKAAVTTLMENAMSTNEPLSPEEKAEILGDNWRPEYDDEARERWGDTPEWDQSQRVQQQMSAGDWESARDAVDALEADLAAAMAEGVEPGSPEANELAERHRANISQWFEVSYAKHVLIATGYTEDPRFAAHYNKRADGLAQWLRAIIDANAAANGVDPATAEWD